jgi:hypothetical protein
MSSSVSQGVQAAPKSLGGFASYRRFPGVLPTRALKKEDLLIGLLRAARPTADELRARWSTATGRAAWSRPHDWWVPEIDALVEALADQRDPISAAAALGAARAEAGVGLRETLDDIEALLGSAAVPVDDVALVRAVAEAWAEAGIDPVRLGTCEDPLSGLASPAYLRTRLAEVYRKPGRPADELALVIVLCDPPPEFGWERLAGALRLGDELRTVFPGDTVARLSGSTAVALTTRSPRLQCHSAELRRRLPGARVWMEGLPERLETAYALLDDLGR